MLSQKGDTALHIAVRGRSKRICEYLLRNPKDHRLLYKPNHVGETPYQIDSDQEKSVLTHVFGASESCGTFCRNHCIFLPSFNHGSSLL